MTPPIRLRAVLAGPARDNGFYESGFRGAETACAAAGLQFALQERVGVHVDALAQAAREAARHAPQMVLVHGGSSDEAVRLVAADFPKVQFLSTHGNLAGPNFSCVNIRQPQSAFLAGALAALLTRTGVVGHLSGIRIHPGLLARAAWAQGAAYANPEVRIISCFCGTQDDSTMSYHHAQKLIAEGVDVLYTMLNFGRAGAIDACREQKIWQIGNVIDWCAVHPDVFIGSAIANNGELVRQWIGDVVAGRVAQGEVRWLGMEDPRAVRLVMADGVPVAVRDRIEEVAGTLMRGEIALDAAFEGQELPADAFAAPKD